MSGAQAALLAGLFLAPALLLWLGHGFRRRSGRWRRVFWGAVIGHTLAMLLMTVAALYPPVEWGGEGFWRDFAVHWSLALGAIVGALAGAAQPRRVDAGDRGPARRV